MPTVVIPSIQIEHSGVFHSWQVSTQVLTHLDLQRTCNPTNLLLTNSSSAGHLAWLDCSSVNCFWSLSLVSFNILSFSAFSVLYNVKASFNWECKQKNYRDFTSDKGTNLNKDIIFFTCFNAALTWEFCAKSAALLLWDNGWVAGDEGLTGKDSTE